MTDQHDHWADKYRPTDLSSIQGNNTALDDIQTWADNWSAGDDAVLLHGPPGVGKTTTAEVLADRLDLPMVEVNASSARTSEDVAELADIIRSTNSDGERSFVLVDEVDSWHHAVRKQPLYDALDDPANPVILTANDIWDVPGGIERRCEDYKFRLGKRSIKAKLKDIAEAEGLDASTTLLDQLADREGLRSAVTDLQIYAQSDVLPGSDNREYEDDEWDVMDQMLTGTPDLGSLDPGWGLLWLDENVSAVYRGLEGAMAYELLSYADLRIGEARRTSYRHWRYARALLETVPEVRQTEPYYDDRVSQNKKSWPAWTKASEPSATDDDAEATLYRELKGYDDGEFRFAGNYHEFRNTILPVLQGLSTEEKYDLILSERLSAEAYDALGVTESAYQSWMEEEAPEAGEWTPEVESADSW